MLFNSYEFAIFFALVYGLYWWMAGRLRWQNRLLLASSMLFYGWWDVRFLFLFILTTVVDFYCALMIADGKVALRQRLIGSAVLVGSAFLCVTVQWKAVSLLSPSRSDWAHALPQSPMGWAVLAGSVVAAVLVNGANGWLGRFTEQRRRVVFLVASLASNFTVLGFFKYYNFFADGLASMVSGLFGVQVSHWTLSIVLPVGISFYTFQSLAYTIDVYRRQFQPIRQYLTVATALSFFPLLVAGPIERPAHLMPQFLQARTLDWQKWKEGTWLIAWGLFKKLVVADNMAVIVAAVFGPYDHGTVGVPHDGLRLLMGVYAFAFQIYGDFSGYSDIAKGTGRLLGFDVMRNFNLPYFAVSPSDFWKRWHISLSSWLRDYLYIPLGGNRGGSWATHRNLFLTMLLGGLWHGAAWTFIIWGAYHGALLIAYRLAAPKLGSGDPLAQVRQAGISLLPGRGGAAAAVKASGKEPVANPIRFIIGFALATLLMFHLTCIGWLLFRARDMGTVSAFMRAIAFSPHGSAQTWAYLKDIAFYSWFLLLFQIVQVIHGTIDPMPRWHWFLRLNVWLFVIMSLLALCAHGSSTFIYFAF